MAQVATKVEYQLDIDLGENGGNLRCQNADDLLNWVERELEYWSWLEPGKRRNATQQIATQQIKPLQTIRALAVNWKNANPPQAVSTLQEVQASIRNFNDRCVCSKSISAEHILTIREELGEEEAILALGFAKAYGLVNNLNTPTIQRVFFHWMMLSQGYTKRSAQGTRRSLNSLLDTIRHRNDLDEEYSHQLHASLSTELEKLIESHQQVRNAGARSIRNGRELLQNERKSSQQRLEQQEVLYRKQMSLREPVGYWKDKLFWHRVGAGITGTVFFLYAALGPISLYMNIPSYFFDANLWKELPLGVFGLIAAGVAVLWSMARVLYRLFQSQLHLANDASERVTMIQTYLAFAQEGHNKEEHLGALTSRLFAPAADGIVKEDLGAIGPVDALQRALGNGS